MTNPRVEALRSMLEKRPGDDRLRFGLAVEYLTAGDLDSGVAELRRYLASADDEGNAWGRLAAALREMGHDDEARDAYEKGIEAALRYGHPTMAEEFREELDDLS